MIFFSSRDWLLPAAAFVAVALLVLVLSYRRAPGGVGLRAACLGLKWLGILALAVCLLNPLWSGQRTRPGANLFAVMVDNSQSMGLHDRIAIDQTGWLDELERNFQVRRYQFDARLQQVENFASLTLDGRCSSIGTVLNTLAVRYKGRPLAGVLLVTDGNATDTPDLAGLPPVYPVVVGSDRPVRDIAIQHATVSQTSFEDAPVSIQADVFASGYNGSNVTVRLTDGDGKQVAEQTQKSRGDPMAFRFQVRPKKQGVLFYRLAVTSDAPGEATLANNQRVLVVDRGHGPHRILYVAGRPNWEYKFLHRAVEEDDQIQLVGLIRIAKREPKFDFRGRVGESSNPLFRGFGNQSKEEIERYDQPVWRQINTRDATELRDGFPKTAEELYAYNAVVLDDIEAEAFTPDQMLLLQKFVSERGGGFLMLGGVESFQEGGFGRTPVGDLLPVYLDRPAEDKAAEQMRFALTREGWLQPWARLRNNEADEKTRVEEMPPFFTLNPARGLKPGASAIAAVTDTAGKSLPALAVQRFGNGRAAALMIGDFWHWGLRDEAAHRDLDKAWRQLVRWLVADVPRRIELRAEPKRGDPNQAVELQVRVRDAKFQPLDNATVSVMVRNVKLTAEPVLSEAGLYQATYVPRETGGYRADAVVTDEKGTELGRAAAGWTTDFASEEFRSLKPNRALLETIAKRTGGEVLTPSALSQFARSLPQRRAPITETWTQPLWHRPAVFLFALACFAAEWGLRRRRGLP